MLNCLRLRCAGLLVFVFALCFTVSPAFSTTYYVSSSAGNDAQNGTASSSPWKTITKVNSKAFQPGDTVLFKRGDVWTKQNLKITSTGQPGQPITFGNYGSGDLPKFDGLYDNAVFHGVTASGRAWIVLDGLHIYGFYKGVWIDNAASNITIRNSRISYIGGECVGIKGNVNNVTIEVNVIHDCGQKGSNGEGVYVGTDPLKAQGIPDRTTNIVIRNNQIYNTKNEAIELKAGTSNCIVQSNLVYDVFDTTNAAIHMGHWADPLIVPNHLIASNIIYNITRVPGILIRSGGITVERNIIYNTGGDGIRIRDNQNTKLVGEVFNNTFYKNAGSSINIQDNARVDASNNLSWGNGSGNISYDPLFANPSGGDFRLCSGVGFPVPNCSGRSPAINTGVHNGRSFIGAAPDLGAIESDFDQTTTPAPLVPSNLKVLPK